MTEKKPLPHYPHSEHDSEKTQYDYTIAITHDPDHIADEEDFTLDLKKDLP